MKLVFNRQETAEALQLCANEFSLRLDDLYHLGFPKPVPGLGERWSIISVINWINRQASAVASAPIANASAPAKLKLVSQNTESKIRSAGH